MPRSVSGQIVVVGGGAAGISAARRLHDAGAEVLLLEARDRLGGRARSLPFAAAAVDLGCGWLHSARRNPWTEIARTRGYSIATDTANWNTEWRDLGFPPAEQAESRAAYGRWYDAARAALGGPDRAISDFVQDEAWRPMLDAVSGYVSGAPLDRVSLHDWGAYDTEATSDNWSIREGYGTLIVDHAAGVPVRTGVAVTRIDHRDARLRIETSGGVLEADQAIVAVPATVLASGDIAFTPALDDHLHAAAGLPLGVADKVFMGVAGATDWPANAHLIGDPRSAITASYRLSPLGLPVIEAFFGGVAAEAIATRDAFAFVADELARLLGSEIRARLVPLIATDWRAEPHIRGSYSYARVGCAGARAVLATPVDDRIRFVGEACSPVDFTTAHGAYQTGVAAADAVLATASRSPR